jgi:glycosyltransferase involved in cell wall biosynthesis
MADGHAAERRPGRLLFASYHCYVDPSSGAALATRDLLRMLAARGWDCRVLCGPQLDFEEGESLTQILSDQGIRWTSRPCATGPTPFTLLQFEQAGIPVTIYTPSAARAGVPTGAEGLPFLALLERVLETYRPDAMLTYGGHWLAAEVIACAKRQGTPVVFGLHNFAYTDAGFFRPVDAVLVPSRFARDYYRRALGLDCTALPHPLDWSRFLCPEVEGRYVTFVNPQPHKGVFVFARIAHELGRRRPDIPLLVVEGRGRADWLHRTGLDLRGVGNLHVMANTPDPRDFYRVSRLVLMPSLWNESFGLVAAESLANGIPVLAGRRGALPELLEQAGFLFDIPAQYTPESRLVPTAAEVAPWVDTVIRLWDDPKSYDDERRRCRTAAEAWRPERLGPLYEAFFAGVAGRAGPAKNNELLSS